MKKRAMKKKAGGASVAKASQKGSKKVSPADSLPVLDPICPVDPKLDLPVGLEKVSVNLGAALSSGVQSVGESSKGVQDFSEAAKEPLHDVEALLKRALLFETKVVLLRNRMASVNLIRGRKLANVVFVQGDSDAAMGEVADIFSIAKSLSEVGLSGVLFKGHLLKLECKFGHGVFVEIVDIQRAGKFWKDLEADRRHADFKLDVLLHKKAQSTPLRMFTNVPPLLVAVGLLGPGDERRLQRAMLDITDLVTPRGVSTPLGHINLIVELTMRAFLARPAVQEGVSFIEYFENKHCYHWQVLVTQSSRPSGEKMNLFSASTGGKGSGKGGKW